MAVPGTLAQAATTRRATVVVVGPLPPPYHGGAVATAFVLRSRLTQEHQVLHLDTTDRRGLANIGRVDIGNAMLALRHALSLLWLLVTARPQAVYVPVAQNRLGLLRDAALIVPALVLRRHVVLHVHGSGLREFYEGAGAGMRALVRLMFGRATRVIVLGESLRPMLDGITEPARIEVLPNGTDDEFGGSDDRAVDEPVVRLLFLGNLMRAKGFIELIDAVAALRSAGQPVELDLAGGFLSDLDRADALQRVAGLGDVVRLHGVVEGERKAELLRQAHIFVFPSHSEGHPYVILEAMAAGLPVIATALPAVCETVLHGETGLIVPVRDERALCSAIIELMGDPEKRVRMGRAARRRFEENYSFGVWSNRLARIVAEALVT
jgi:glycosyltransferase involved in cell wall biosynthesis